MALMSSEEHLTALNSLSLVFILERVRSSSSSSAVGLRTIQQHQPSCGALVGGGLYEI